MRAGRALAAALSCVVIGGACSSAPDFDKELATVRSWTATVDLAADERHAHATTRAYTARLFAEAADALEQSRHQLVQAAHSDDERARARASLDSLATALSRHQAEAVGR
jgi:hypothetical protein